MFSANATLVFKPSHAQRWVSDELTKPVKRTAFYEWRKTLNMLEGPYTMAELQAITIFGRFVQSGASYQQARTATLQTLKNNEVTTND